MLLGGEGAPLKHYPHYGLGEDEDNRHGEGDEPGGVQGTHSFPRQSPPIQSHSLGRHKGKDSDTYRTCQRLDGDANEPMGIA